MFEGFTPETIDFLWGIRMNNNRDWFLEHKKQYVDTLYTPMKELGQLLFEPFLEKPGSILKVSRIYRDARLHHPLPYKESLWCCIRQDVDWWAENPCLFLEIRRQLWLHPLAAQGDYHGCLPPENCRRPGALPGAAAQDGADHRHPRHSGVLQAPQTRPEPRTGALFRLEEGHQLHSK